MVQTYIYKFDPNCSDYCSDQQRECVGEGSGENELMNENNRCESITDGSAQ